METWGPSLAAFFALLTAIVGLILRHDVKVVHRSLNSRVDELVELTRQLADAKGFARGLLQGRTEESTQRTRPDDVEDAPGRANAPKPTRG